MWSNIIRIQYNSTESHKYLDILHSHSQFKATSRNFTVAACLSINYKKTCQSLNERGCSKDSARSGKCRIRLPQSHAVCGIHGVIHSYDMTAASVPDIHYLKDLQWKYHDCMMPGDKGYLSAEVQKISLRLPTSHLRCLVG